MRSKYKILICLGLVMAPPPPAYGADCPHNPDALGVSRVLELDTADGPFLGTMQFQKTLKLAHKEIVLTFDDGPHELYTRRVLAALAHHCTRGIFFPIGKKVQKYPEIFRSVEAQGHTIGAHSWSHPMNLRRLPLKAAKLQIEKGFNVIQAHAARPIAPFFRFPGLNMSKALKQYTAKRGYAVFSTDISSDDWMAIGPEAVTNRTVSRLRRRDRGILIFHDAGSVTWAALPAILDWLKRNNFRVVHVVPRTPYISNGNKSNERTAGSGGLKALHPHKAD